MDSDSIVIFIVVFVIFTLGVFTADHIIDKRAEKYERCVDLGYDELYGTFIIHNKEYFRCSKMNMIHDNNELFFNENISGYILYKSEVLE